MFCPIAMSKTQISGDKATLLATCEVVKRPRICSFFTDALTLANRALFPFRDCKQITSAFVLRPGTTVLEFGRSCTMRYRGSSLISKLAILLTCSAFSLAGHAQQIPCPLNYDYTNSDAATNSIYCDIMSATFDNTATGILTNLQGGTLSIDPDSFVYNSGFFYNDGTIQNQRALINEPAGYMDNSGTIFVHHKLENDSNFINLPSGQIWISQSSE